MKTSFHYAIDFNNKPANSQALIMSVNESNSNPMIHFQYVLCMEIGMGNILKMAVYSLIMYYEYREDTLIFLYWKNG